LNGKLMRHRSKSPQRVVTELVDLARRYAVLDFAIVDNIIDLGYFETVLPRVAHARRLHLRLFCRPRPTSR
jgi:hypothetical protein